MIHYSNLIKRNQKTKYKYFQVMLFDIGCLLIAHNDKSNWALSADDLVDQMDELFLQEGSSFTAQSPKLTYIYSDTPTFYQHMQTEETAFEGEKLKTLLDYTRRVVSASQKAEDESPLQKRCRAFIAVLETDWICNMENKRPKHTPVKKTRAIDILVSDVAARTDDELLGSEFDNIN